MSSAPGNFWPHNLNQMASGKAGAVQGNLAATKKEIARSPLFPSPGSSSEEAAQECEVILETELQLAWRNLTRPDIWILAKKIAKARLERGGKLSKAEIDALLPS
jgi:hypothetical protein